MKILTKYHKAIGIIIILSVLGSFYLLKDGIRIDNSLDIWFVQDDEVFENYTDFRKRYSNDEIVAIYVRSVDAFDIKVVEKMMLMSSEIDSLDFVHSVFSPASAPFIAATSLGPRISALLPSVPQSEHQINIFKNRINSYPHYKSLFFDKYEKGFMVYAMLRAVEGELSNPEYVTEIKEIVNKYFYQAHYGGIPIINEALNNTTAKESAKVSILSILAVIVLLFVFLRKWRYVVISVLSVLIPVIWLFAAFTYFDGAFNMITVVIPTLLLITGTATSIHIVNICHREFVSSSASVEESLKKALKYVFVPCLFTATTTMAGFISLYASSIEVIKQTGILAAIGVALVFICSFVVTAVAFLLFPPKKEKLNYQSIQLASKTNLITGFFSKVNIKQPKLVMIIFPLTIVIALFSITKMRTETYPFDYLEKNSTVLNDNFIIEENVGPFLPVEILLIKDSAFNLYDIQKVIDFKTKLNETGYFANLFSTADILGYLNSALYKSDNHYFPNNVVVAERLLQIYLQNRTDKFQKYDNEDFTELRISATTKIASSADYEIILEKIFAAFNEVFTNSEGITLSPRGYLPMYVEMNNHIIWGQIRTFLIAFFLILALIVLCFKSFKLALLSLLPNLFPIALILIVMWMFGIAVDQSTAVITCIILGVAFDDSIHLMYAYQKERKKGASAKVAADISLDRTASAMISTSIALFAGFAIIASSSITGLSYFGILCAIAVTGSLLGNIWLFPLLLGKLK
ncbi:MAG: MMPL family transporter [Bacteroidetes bacterium]|nr:MMPL family transporter [Bacteroidota bacterium]